MRCKKLAAILLSMVMVVVFSVPAMAETYYVVRTTKTTTTLVNGVVTDVKTEVSETPASGYVAPTYTAPTTTYVAPSYTAPATNYVAPAVQATKTVYDYGYATLGDEAKKRAEEIRSYASEKGLSASTSGDWGDCNYRRVTITIGGHKLEQLTQVNGSTYNTVWEYGGSAYSKDGAKDLIKWWASGNSGGSSSSSSSASYAVRQTVAPASSSVRTSSSGALYKEAASKADSLKAKANNNHWTASAVDTVAESDTLAQKRLYVSNKYGSHTIDVITETQWAGGYYTTVKIDGAIYDYDGAVNWLRNNRD